MKIWKLEIKKEDLFAGIFLLALQLLSYFVLRGMVPGILVVLFIPLVFILVSRFFFRISKFGSLVSLATSIFLAYVVSYALFPCDTTTTMPHSCEGHILVFIWLSETAGISVLSYIILSTIMDFLDSGVAKKEKGT